ncbi:U2 small nuclear ribonucleoprotein B'' [Dendrobium catenatum]|uniref:RRM domain-containing protein n=1 Tax=Dendrobium catenatum TaxID=906689 RepID=A0A2I0X6R6_9ASPA|nr:U2 small nuclear ribonucleoprotein B'' [Dendrobium catenatum]PKU83603.1 hypothetical protein MA16_Dca019830 [Dendrobium catenatum]
MAHATAQPYHDYPYDMRPLPYPAPPPASHSPAGHFHPSNPAVGLHSPYYVQHYTHPPPPVPIVNVNPQQQKINTLFVSGLPDDVKAREIHNLFSRHHGFEYCQLEYTGRGNQAVAFATFINHHSAVAAMGALDRTIFDPETRATLHIELARSNSKKRSRGASAYSVIDKRAKVQEDDQNDWTDDGDVGSDASSDTENDNSHKKGALAATQSGEAEGKLTNGRAALDSEKTTRNIPPCSTLFIANLGPNCSETELNKALSKFSGFQTLKMRAKWGMPVAFADFENVESSTAAMESLEGTLIDSSDRGGMHIEYARSKMRRN